MARVHKLTAVAVRQMTAPGKYGDGDGLWLQITPPGSKSWLLRYMLNGRARAMGLGPVDLLSLAEARERARAARKLLLDGRDPIEERKNALNAAKVADGKAVSFRQATDRYLLAHERGWRNEKHRAQWRSTLETYCHPVIGHLAISTIDTNLVLQYLSLFGRLNLRPLDVFEDVLRRFWTGLPRGVTETVKIPRAGEGICRSCSYLAQNSLPCATIQPFPMRKFLPSLHLSVVATAFQPELLSSAY